MENSENRYLKILKERYLSLIVMPIVIIGWLFVWAYTAGANVHYMDGIVIADDEAVHMPSAMELTIFIAFFWQIATFLSKSSQRKFAEAFMYLTVRSLVIISAYTIGYELYPHFTQKIENLEKEKRFYWNRINSSNQQGSDGKGKLVWLTSMKQKGSMDCKLVYDESDTLLDPSGNYRGMGRYFSYGNLEPLSVSANSLSYNSFITSSSTLMDGYYEAVVLTEATKIEPYFYTVCQDFKNAVKAQKQEPMESLLKQRELYKKANEAKKAQKLKQQGER